MTPKMVTYTFGYLMSNIVGPVSQGNQSRKK